MRFVRHALGVGAAMAALGAMTPAPAVAERGLSLPSGGRSATFYLEINDGILDVVCTITIDVAFHERVSKAAAALMGLADVGLQTGGCLEGEAGMLVGGRRVVGPQGPYHVEYSHFNGSLPHITTVGFRIMGVSFWIEQPAWELGCLASGNLAATTTGGNPATGIQIFGTVLLTGDFLCLSSSAFVYGTGGLTRSMTMTLF